VSLTHGFPPDLHNRPREHVRDIAVVVDVSTRTTGDSEAIVAWCKTTRLSLCVTHKSGATQGDPLSISSYRKVIRAIAAASPELKGLHGHLFRHGWNERFSEYMDRQEAPPSPEQQEDMRSNVQGWKEDSGTSATYNRRFVERKAHDTQLQLQEKAIRLPKGIDK